jgi:uncharacterized membrane protein YdbT with pleckstrin-like domain
MNITNELLLRPAVSFAFFKTVPLVFTALLFLLLAWCLSLFFLLFSFVLIGAAWYRLLYIRRSSYLITPDYIRVDRGIFFKRTDQIEMFRIKDYIVTRPFTLQLLGLMNLTLKSTDPENPVLRMTGIPYADLLETIRDFVQKARMNNHIFEIN